MIAPSAPSMTTGDFSRARSRTRVKICGITRIDDARRAVELGADAIGLILTDSTRRIDLDRAARIVRSLPPFVLAVGVFRQQSPSDINLMLEVTGLHVAQLHGDESPADCAAISRPVIKRFDIRPDDDNATLRRRVAEYNVAAHLLDPGAGEGRPFDYALARDVSPRLIIAGGLSSTNVACAIAAAAPFAVDVCSGIERAPGEKDLDKLSAFLQEVRRHDADIHAA
ncbi:MAG TPA: phosphoribosylanthranilate isomerase [Phycisphaerae bacterium]|nr:phosphoribosylanthranilate isomerase [Phycisphaerae bacterium]HRW52048.1 phosphoribosylanthranilate isomerase [Phycisphaerae bacterium]